MNNQNYYDYGQFIYQDNEIICKHCNSSNIESHAEFLVDKLTCLDCNNNQYI